MKCTGSMKKSENTKPEQKDNVSGWSMTQLHKYSCNTAACMKMCAKKGPLVTFPNHLKQTEDKPYPTSSKNRKYKPIFRSWIETS